MATTKKSESFQDRNGLKTWWNTLDFRILRNMIMKVDPHPIYYVGFNWCNSCINKHFFFGGGGLGGGFCWAVRHKYNVKCDWPLLESENVVIHIGTCIQSWFYRLIKKENWGTLFPKFLTNFNLNSSFTPFGPCDPCMMNRTRMHRIRMHRTQMHRTRCIMYNASCTMRYFTVKD